MYGRGLYVCFVEAAPHPHFSISSNCFRFLTVGPEPTTKGLRSVTLPMVTGRSKSASFISVLLLGGPAYEVKDKTTFRRSSMETYPAYTTSTTCLASSSPLRGARSREIASMKSWISWG